METPASEGKDNGVYGDAKTSKFHFKSTKSKEHSKRHRSRDRDEDTNESTSRLDPETAFRESLFDAMADGEGAEYWEGVYGQPIHIYPNTFTGPGGELERMNDEEYADYVRTKMWEKSHQHILEERAAREKARQKKKDEGQCNLEEDMAKEAAERERVMSQMEESLKRGEERKRAKAAAAAFVRYLSRWDDLKNNAAKTSLDQDAREIIPWPVISGKAYDVEKDEIERFLRASGSWKDDATALLKIERVRWHPDKMQQRFGQHIDADTMKLVTAVFQVVDRLWNERDGRRK
ncbi:hypothetical protein P280DRAFT_462885 [Massarina eburnea CBS 473.64]|uniref:Uncharacterized protein n=1 Tax=Massarina eburnea CBS 473.64 TaxID=1395130 RepID=A0A6A6RGZ2_9PLEO|nr:hypothetical protein P280DRAFT_462885 [Massarina eburnea CBS 473.64]